MAFLLQSVMEWTGIASIPDFPFTLCPHARHISCDFLYGSSSTLLWTLQDGVTRSVNNSSSSLFVLPVGSTVSIFHLSLSTLSEDEKRLAQNALRRARTLRIRGLLQCFGGTEYKEHIYIATEHCIPLAHYLLADITHPSMLSPAFSSSFSSASLHGRCTERSASNPCSVSCNAKTIKREDESWMSDTNEKTLFIQRELDAVCWEEESDPENESDNDSEGDEEMGEESNEDAVSVHDDHHQNSTRDPSQVTDDIQSVEEDLSGSTHRAEGTTTAGGCSVPMQQRSDWLLFAYSGVSPKTLALGLKNITKGIHALHANQLHHGNIHPSCVFVAVRTGFWLLFGFEFLSEIGETQTARQTASTPPSSSFSFPWGSGSHGNGGGAAGQEFRMENGLSFMSGGPVYFSRLKKQEGQWKGKQGGPERSSSAGNLSTRGRNNPLEGLVPPEFSLPPQAGGGSGEGGSSSSSHSTGLEKDDNLLSTSMSSVSKFWNTWVNAGPVSTKSAEEMRMHEHCTPILSSILEAPWKAAAWDAWGLSRLFYFSYVALQYQMHVLGGGSDCAAAQATPSNAAVSGAPKNDVHEGAGRERWEQFCRSLCKVAEQLGADDPKERLQGASSFADLLRDEEDDAEDGRRGNNSSKSVAGICWSQEEYVKCMEMTELYPVLEADERDQIVWRVMRELYTSLHTYITPSSPSFIASCPSKESSGPMTHGGRPVWSLTPFSGVLWMIERIMANLFSHIPRRLVVGILLLGQHLLLPPRTRIGSDDGGNTVAASYASAKKESAHAAVRDALLPLDACSTSVASPSAFSTVGAFWYDGTIGPLLAYMFRLREPFIRFQLLESTPLYAPYLSTSRWNDEIWPLLAECFRNASQSSLEILIATTKTAIFAAPYLSSAVLAEQVIPSIRKHLITHPDPSLRVNGLLCVSQILPHIGQDRCGPLAAEVYGRSVQDTHDAVRFVSVKAIQTCLQWMTPIQVVKYALPLVIPLAVDRYTPSREGSWAVIQESLHLFRATYGTSVPAVGESTASAPPSRATPPPPTSVTSASARSAEGGTSASFFSRESTPPVHGRQCSTASSSSCPSLEANPGSRYGERHSQAGAVVPSLAGTAALEMEEWHFHLPQDHFDALRLLKELDHDLHSPLLSAHPAPSRRRSLVSFSSPPTAIATETPKEPSRREEGKGTAPAPLTRIPPKEEEWQAGGQWSEETPTPAVAPRVTTSSEWNREHHDPQKKRMLHALPVKGEGLPVGGDTIPGVTQVVSPTQAIPLAIAARRYSAMFLPSSTTTSLPSRLPGATAKSLDLEGFSLGHSPSPLASAGGGRGGGSTTKSIPHRSTISSLRFTAAPKQPQDGKLGESENEAVLHNSSLHSTGILSESSETEGVSGSRAEWGSRRGCAFGDSAMNSLAGSATNPLTSSNSDGRGIKSIGSKRVGKGLGGRKCD